MALRMTLAPPHHPLSSLPPLQPTPLPSLHCSPTCRFSCPWTTPPCTSLSPLTWGCPCAAWRSSTNQPAPPSLLLLTPTGHSDLCDNNPRLSVQTPHSPLLSRSAMPRPSASCGTSCARQVGLQSLFLSPSRPFIKPSNVLPSRLVTKAVYTPPGFFFPPVFYVSVQKKCLHLHVLSVSVSTSCLVHFLAAMLLCLGSVTNTVNGNARMEAK